MLVPFQFATSSRTRVVAVGDLGDLAAHDPGDPGRPVASQTSTVSASKLRSTPSSVVIFSPSRGGADGQRPARHLVEVEGVQRLRGQQHHVVGDVDDVVDRPLPGRRQPRLQPERRGADRDVGEDAGGEARAELGDLDRDRGVVGDLSLALGGRVLGPGLGPSGAPVIAWTSRATP